VEFSDDGAQAISGSDDGTVRVSEAPSRLRVWVMTISCPRYDAWWIWQVRFWDTASGEEVRQIASSEFAFADAGARGTEQQTSHHFLEALDDTLLITELPLHGGVGDGATPVACFRAPQGIGYMHCRGTTICVGCWGGAVCILQAPFLAI